MTEEALWGPCPYFVYAGDALPIQIKVKGRMRWALEALIRAGERGSTPIDCPAPRWSAYIHDLRRMGVTIETVREHHDGPFSGTHARYVLRCRVLRSLETQP